MDGNPLASYVGHCRPLRLAAPWSELPIDPFAHLGPADPAAALGALRRDHSDEQLIDAGLAIREATGSVAIHPFLSTSDMPLVALRARRKSQVINLMTSDGCIVPPHIPLFATLRDFATFKGLARHNRIMYATGDFVDAVLLRSLGLAAAPIAGLDTLDGHGIALLDQLYDLDAWDRSVPLPKQVLEARASHRLPGDRRNTGVYTQLELTVVAPSIHAPRLSEPPSVARALQHLEEGAAVLGGGPIAYDAWCPSQDTLDGMVHALDWHIPTRAVSLLLESLENECRSSLLGPARPNEPPPDLASTAAQLQACMADWGTDAQAQIRLKTAIAAYAAQVEREILAPLMQHLSTISDPVLRLRQFSLVQMTSLLMAEAQRFQYRSHSSRTGNDDHQPTKGELSELLTAAKQIDHLAKEIASCRPQRRRRRPR
jgi:hypothetical protein